MSMAFDLTITLKGDCYESEDTSSETEVTGLKDGNAQTNEGGLLTDNAAAESIHSQDQDVNPEDIATEGQDQDVNPEDIATEEETCPCACPCKCRCRCMTACTNRVKRFMSNNFQRYGTFVGNHPLIFITLPIVILVTLGACMTKMEFETDIEEIYFPIDSRASKERAIVFRTFPDLSFKAFNVYSLSYPDIAFNLLFITKEEDVLERQTVKEIRGIVRQMNEIKITVQERVVKQNEFGCARVAHKCVIDGEYALDYSFTRDLANGSVTYPFWTDQEGVRRDLSTAIGQVETKDGVLVSAKVLLLSFKMAYITNAGQDRFKEVAALLNPLHTKMTYAVPNSLSEEVDESTGGDTVFFVATIIMSCIYAMMVSSGGNPVSARTFLALAGCCATGISILGAMGGLSLFGVKYVNIVGVIPFLILGIGIDDMFLMMAGWTSSLGETQWTVSYRLGRIMRDVGVGISITSLTDFLAFAIGTSSVFKSIITFSLYAGLSVLFCFLTNITLFLACLGYHGRRVYEQRHFLTCRKVLTPQEMKSKGANACMTFFCSGTIPLKNSADESLCESVPRRFLPLLIARKPMCCLIVLGFMGYLGVAIYGALNLKQGLLLKDLVRISSYYYPYLIQVYKYFPVSLPIGFIVNSTVDYAGPDGQRFQVLLGKARQDPMIIADFERCWLPSYLNSTFYNQSAPEEFVPNLGAYINATPDFQADVVFSPDMTEVNASRCFVLSEKSNDEYAQADLMARLRAFTDNSTLPVFVYHSSFLKFEQFLAILPATLQMLGCAVASMTVVTAAFLPQLLTVSLVVITICMILTGIFGFMYFWDITLSPITMIHLVMSVGFSVDFSAHTCAAYLMSETVNRHGRALHALKHAASPILNGALSTLIGVLFLVFSESYVFVTFFKIMVLVMVLGMLHAVLFLPAILALIGPQGAENPEVSSHRRDSVSIAGGSP